MSWKRALVLVLVVSCAGPRSAPVPEAEPAPTFRPRGIEVVSNAGTYRVVYRTTPEDVPRGELFDVAIWILDADGNAVSSDYSLAVDAGMPQHRHGMNVLPRLAPRADGGFDATGLLFHMSGAWTMTFDVEVDGVTERAQAVIELD